MDAISYKQKEYLYSYFRSKPPELNLHLHKYYEFLYFISGDATYIVEDNLYKIHPGDILLTRPGELHTIFFQSEKPYERIFMQIHPDFIPEFDLFDHLWAKITDYRQTLFSLSDFTIILKRLNITF